MYRASRWEEEGASAGDSCGLNQIQMDYVSWNVKGVSLEAVLLSSNQECKAQQIFLLGPN